MVFVLLDKVKSFDISKVLICQTKRQQRDKYVNVKYNQCRRKAVLTQHGLLIIF